MVATTKGAEGISYEAGRHLLIADTAQAFAEATLQLLSDRAAHERIRKAARQIAVGRYDWNTIGDFACKSLAEMLKNTGRQLPHL
jgi:glycosyltransferase involved in cell wall biosynthesis